MRHLSATEIKTTRDDLRSSQIGRRPTVPTAKMLLQQVPFGYWCFGGFFWGFFKCQHRSCINKKQTNNKVTTVIKCNK